MFIDARMGIKSVKTLYIHLMTFSNIFNSKRALWCLFFLPTAFKHFLRNWQDVWRSSRLVSSYCPVHCTSHAFVRVAILVPFSFHSHLLALITCADVKRLHAACSAMAVSLVSLTFLDLARCLHMLMTLCMQCFLKLCASNA